MYILCSTFDGNFYVAYQSVTHVWIHTCVDALVYYYIVFVTSQGSWLTSIVASQAVKRKKLPATGPVCPSPCRRVTISSPTVVCTLCARNKCFSTTADLVSAMYMTYSFMTRAQPSADYNSTTYVIPKPPHVALTLT